MKWNGIKNGELMSLCVDNSFDVLLTIDKNLIFQKTIDNLTIAVLNSSTSKIEELVLLGLLLKLKLINLRDTKFTL